MVRVVLATCAAAAILDRRAVFLFATRQTCVHLPR